MWCCSSGLRGARPTLLLGGRPTLLPTVLVRPYRRRSGPHGHFKPGSSNRTPQLQSQVEPGDAAAAKKYKKMPMCMTFGYVGTAFHGLQSQPKRPDLPTIAKTVRQALLESGAIAQSNIEPLARTKWSLSSRTDKGVHATGAAASFRMETLPEQLEEHGGRLVLGAGALCVRGCNATYQRLQPYPSEAATPHVRRGRGGADQRLPAARGARLRRGQGEAASTRGPCNPTCARLQPYVGEAATLCVRGCNPMCARLQPVCARLQACVSGARWLRRAALRQLPRVRIPATTLGTRWRLGGRDSISRARVRPYPRRLPGLQP